MIRKASLLDDQEVVPLAIDDKTGEGKEANVMIETYWAS